MARPTLPTTDRLDPARLQIAYYERADRSGRFYLLIGLPGLAPSLVAAGLKSGSAETFEKESAGKAATAAVWST